MKKPVYSCTVLALLLCGVFFSFKPAGGEHPTLPIGAKAPDFSLQGVDGKTYTLNSFKKSPILVVVFTCNHCPTAQAYEGRIIKLTSDYQSKGVAVVAIMPNDPNTINLDELGYTDLSDTYAEMKIRANEKHFNFPYLYDGATQSVAHAYGPIATPHVFIFDKDRKLCYSGRIDDVEKPTKTPHIQDTRNALNSLLAGKMPDVTTTKVFGCSIKWAEKANWHQRAREEWAKEPVNLNDIGAGGLKSLLQNKTDSLLVINLWDNSSSASLSNFSVFIEANRMYRRRDFEMVSINAGGAAKKNGALKFLKRSGASFINYSVGKQQLINAIGPKWTGALPYTLIVEPGGKIVYAKQGVVDPAELKRVIVDDPLIGRYY